VGVCAKVVCVAARVAAAQQNGQRGDYNKQSLTDKLMRARATCGSAVAVIQSAASQQPPLQVANWTLQSVKPGELHILNTVASSGPNSQKALIDENTPGFAFESCTGQMYSFTAESTLPNVFATGWANKAGRRSRFTREAAMYKNDALVRQLWMRHLNNAQVNLLIVDECVQYAQGRPRAEFTQLNGLSQVLSRIATDRQYTADNTSQLQQVLFLHTLIPHEYL
jgi:hypothetical protein